MIYDKIKKTIRNAMKIEHSILSCDAGDMKVTTPQHQVVLYPILFADGLHALQLSIQTKHPDDSLAIREIAITCEALVAISCVLNSYIDSAMKEETKPAEFGGAE